ncbi:MAG TPA: protoporphyrinogen oxidase [Pirellulales bacterium]|nr:protoporphyrinogen oxidase [Pirellulales bacterium]
MSSIAPPRRIAVIGGGIAGLAAAHRLLELDPSVRVTLFEASGRLGGSLHTVSRDGFLIEQGADSFITNVPWGVDLCRRIGLADELIGTNPEGRRAFVVRRGRLRPVPDGFMLMAPSRIWPVLTTPILSPLGKLRLAWEFFIPRRSGDGDESLASFVRRRLGREAFERLVQPLVAGIYTADPEKLSLAGTVPRFQEMERQHGGLIRAAMRGKSAQSDGPINHAVDQEPASGA